MKKVLFWNKEYDYEINENGKVTPVCTTEIIAFAKANTYFEKLNTQLIGLSVDSNPSHEAE